MTTVDESRPLTPEEIQEARSILGTPLFYSRAIDNTSLAAINMINSRMKAPTTDILTEARKSLLYLATYPNAHITFYPSDMRLIIHSDGSHLSEAGARSRAGGYFFLGDKDDVHTINGSIDVISTIIPTVTASTAETTSTPLMEPSM